VNLTINSRFLETNMKGIGRYALELSTALKGLDPSINFVCPKYVLERYKDVEEILKPHRARGFSGHMWEQIELPLYLRKHGNPLLLNFVNTGPVLYNRQITVIYDVSYLQFSRAYSKPFFFYYKMIILAVIKRSRRIITISEFSRNELIKEFNLKGERVDIVYPFLPTRIRSIANKAIEAFPNKHGRYILAVSSLKQKKNIKGILDAFRLAELKDMKLVIVGEHSTIFRREDFGKYIDNKVTFTGFVEDDELASLYNNASLFVFPSLYEGFGIPPLEAMAFGCPVIASNRTSLPEVCGDAAYYVDPTDVKQIAQAIKRLVTDENLRNELVAKGRKRLKYFTLEESVLKLYGILKTEMRHH